MTLAPGQRPDFPTLSYVLTIPFPRCEMPIRRIRDATEPFCFNILQTHIDSAKCMDPRKCAVSNAIMDAHKDAMAVETGTTVVKIITKKEIIRYKTPASLSRAVIIFDHTKFWPLPEGDYTLKPLCASQTQKGRKERAKREVRRRTEQVDTFRNRNTPTRRLTRPESLVGAKL